MVRIITLSLLFLASSVFANAAHDPTAPLSWKKSTSTKNMVYTPSLQSILCDENTCRAVVSNKIVSVGQSVQGYKVKSINKDKVTLIKGSKTWNLELFANVIKN